MKKLFQIIGIISIMVISFFYTEKTVSVVKEYDDIMIMLKNNQKKYLKEYVNAYINKDTIIPGISGYALDINRSYSKMKRYGKYNESLIVLKKTKPKISINNYKNKYIISGNKKLKNISLVFIVNDSIDDIIDILDKKEVKGNFFINHYWLEKNTNLVPIIINEKHNVGMIEYTNYNWSRDIIKKIGKQKYEFCSVLEKNKDIFNICNGYVFIPTYIKNNPYENTKSKLNNGSILAYKITNELVDELPVIINYIKSKGYNIVNLETLFTE